MQTQIQSLSNLPSLIPLQKGSYTYNKRKYIRARIRSKARVTIFALALCLVRFRAVNASLTITQTAWHTTDETNTLDTFDGPGAQMNFASTATCLTESFSVYYVDNADPCLRKIKGINISLTDFDSGDTGIVTGLVGASSGGGVVSQTESFDSMINKVQIYSQAAANYEISGLKVTTTTGSTYEFGGVSGCTAQDEFTINQPILSMEFAYTGTNLFQSIRWYYNSGFCHESGSLSFDSGTSSFNYDANNGYEQATSASLLDVTYTSTCAYTPYYSATLADDSALPSNIVFDASKKVFTVSNNDKNQDGTSIDVKITVGLGDLLFDVKTLTINIIDPCDNVSLSGVTDVTKNWNLNSQPRTQTWSDVYTLDISTNNAPGVFDDDYCGQVIVAIQTLNAADPFIYSPGPQSSISITSATYLDEGVYNYQIFGYLQDYPTVETTRANLEITVMDPCDNDLFSTTTMLSDETWPISSTDQSKTLDLPTATTTCLVDYTYSVTPNTIQTNAEVFSFTRTAPQAYSMDYRCNNIACDGTYTVTITGTLLHETSVTLQKSFTLTIGTGAGCSPTSFSLTSSATLPDVLYQQIGSYSYDPVFTYAPDIDCGEQPIHSFTQSSVDGVTLSPAELTFTESTASFVIDVSNPAYYGKSVDIVLRADITGFYVETNFKIKIEDPCQVTTFVGQTDITINYTLLDPIEYSSPINLQTQLEQDHSLTAFYCGTVLVTTEQVTTNTPIASFAEVNYDSSSQRYSAYTNDPNTSVGSLIFNVQLQLQSHPSITTTFQITYNIVQNSGCQTVVPKSQNLEPILTIRNLNTQAALTQFNSFSSDLIDMSACGSQTYQVIDENEVLAGDFVSYVDDYDPQLFLKVDSEKITKPAGVYEYYIKMTLDSYPGFQHLEPFNVVILDLTDEQPQQHRTSVVGQIDTFSLTPWELKPAGYCTINYSAIDLPSFISFDEATLTFKVDATLSDISDQVGDYSLQVKVTLDNCFSPDDFSMLSQRWVVTVKEQDNPYTVDINSPNLPPFFTENLAAQQANVGVEWSYTLPEALDPDQDMITYNIELGAADQFITFDETSKTLNILEGESSEEHVGQYSITISLVDSQGNKSQDSVLSLEILTNLVQEDESPLEEEVQAEEENQNEIQQNDEVDVQENQNILKQFEWNWEQKDMPEWKPGSFEARLPKAQIKKVSAYGQLEIEFDKVMSIPQNISIYEDYFKENNQLKPILEVKVVPGYSSYEQNLTFSWFVQSFQENTMILQLYFDNAIYVSANSDPDEVELNFNFEKGFTDIYNVHIEEDVSLKRIIPQQIQIDEKAQTFTQTMDAMQTGATAVMAGNFATNLLLSASLNQLWSLINTQQIIVMFPLLKITQPANSMVFFNFVMQIAAFDIIPTDGFYYKFFNLPVTEPLTVNFESLGFESAWFVTNLGSMAIFMSFFPLILILILLSYMVTKYAWGRRLQTYLKKLIFWNSTITLLMESYAILCLCCMVNIKMYSWNSIEETSQTVVSIIAMVFCTALPLVFWYLFYKYFEKAYTKEAIAKYGALYEELDYKRRDKGRIVILQPVFFLARRFILSACVVWLLNHLWCQALVVALLSIFGAIIIGHVKPFIRPRNRMEYFNEVMIMVAMYHFVCFTDLVASIQAKYLVGYSLISMVALHICINLFLMIWTNIYVIRMSYKRWRSISLYNKIRERKLAHRNQRYPRTRQGRRRRNLSRRNAIRIPAQLPLSKLQPIKELPSSREIESPVSTINKAAQARRNQLILPPNLAALLPQNNERQTEEVKEEEEVVKPPGNRKISDNLVLESLSSNDYFSPRKPQSYIDIQNKQGSQLTQNNHYPQSNLFLPQARFSLATQSGNITNQWAFSK